MVILVGCSGVKRSGALPAWQKYDGPLWKSLRAVEGVEHLINTDQIYVISALYGVFPASRIINDYDYFLTNKESVQNLANLIKTQEIPQTIHVFAGIKYREALTLGGVQYTFASGGIGYKRQKLKQLIMEIEWKRRIK